LDAEQEAGDLATDDFAALRDDYVARAAAVLRALEERDAMPVEAGRGSRRTLVTAVAALAFAVLAGVALATTAGSRPAGAPLTGSLPTSTADRLARASQLIGEDKAVEAIKLYDQILKDDPNQPAALAYRGWIVRLAGLKDEGLAYEDRAVTADPSYPDAHFFRGMMLWQDKGDPAAAVAEFRLFLSNRPPQAMVQLVEDALARASEEAGITDE
ncbi:MAG: hypothetical protein QOI61_2154, partial [Actinomycetota bacterium]